MKNPIDVPDLKKTQEFYDKLLTGEASRNLWGKNKRFDGERISEKMSVQHYFTNVVTPYLTKDFRILDVGCGPGGFLIALAPFCKELVGIDISPGFVQECCSITERKQLHNVKVLNASSDKMPFDDNYFDALIMVDVLHHIENIQDTIQEAYRVLKPGGRIFVFEPNRANPLLYLMCLFDRNEWGLLHLGTKSTYLKLLTPSFSIEEIKYNGLLIGPESKISLKIADLLNQGNIMRFFGWLNPKISLRLRKKQD